MKRTSLNDTAPRGVRMSRREAGALLAGTSLALVSGSALRAFGAEPSDPAPTPKIQSGPQEWVLFRGDSMATGHAAATLPEELDVVWEKNYDGDGFESTAAIGDGVVYLATFNGSVKAFDLASGDEKWTVKADLGFSASPSLRHGRLYLGDISQHFFCIDCAKGDVLWKFECQAEINSSANFHGDNVLFGSQDSQLYCLDAKTGNERWRYSTGDQIRCTPTIVEDFGFVAGCDGALHIVDLLTGASSRKVPIDSPTGCTPAVLGSRVFFGTEGETFYAIDWRSAEVAWTFKPDKSARYRASAAVSDNRVFVPGHDKKFHAFNAATGNELWSAPLPGKCDSSPVLVGDRLFFGTDNGRLLALSAKDGAKLWEFEAGGAFKASPAVVEGRLVIGNTDGDLFCFGDPG